MPTLNLPYDKIDMGIHDTLVVSNVDVIFTFHGDELCISRDYEPADAKLGYPEMHQIDLSFTLDDAIRLRDFLNFAIPHTP